jgi:hypothetical protein
MNADHTAEMEPSDSIGRIGFRKWYERQLIEGHAWLITCILCMIVVFASLEGFSFREGSLRAFALLGVVFACVAIGWIGWSRYLVIMTEAERLADRSICPQCETYGRFFVERVPRGSVMEVRCRKCDAAWTID